jgi:intein/homing endonuclease
LRTVAEIENAMIVFADEACQLGENGHMFDILVKNQDIKKELEFLFFHPRMINIDEYLWEWARDLFMFGDHFMEMVIDPDEPKLGVLRVQVLPPESVYRIETIKGKLVEFQQSKEGPDYNSLSRVEVTKATEAELAQATAIRFAPESIIHFRIGGNRKTFYPYGVSLVEAARGPAHQLKLMEDAMLVYRLCLVGDTKIRTPNGCKDIKDIKINDIVYCMDQENHVREVPVVWFVNNGKQKTLKVKTQHSSIIGTLTHPLLVNRNGVLQWVDLQDIIPYQDKLVNVTQDAETSVPIPKVDCSVVMLKKEHHFKQIDKDILQKTVDEIVGDSNIDKIKLSNSIHLFLVGRNHYGLRRNQADIVCKNFNLSLCSLKTTKRKQKELNLPSHVDEDFARFFGFMLGDGCILRSAVNMRFATSPDKALNDKYRNLMQKYFGSVSFTKDKRSSHPECGNWTVNSVEAVQIMLTMGYRCSTSAKRIPTWLYTASKNIRRAFIEGISDADGCERFTKAGTWFSTIAMSNKNLIEDIKEIWHSIGLCSGHIKTRTRKSSFRKSWNRFLPETTSYELTITDRELPKYDTVWSVEESLEQEVYDFTVGHPAHNFVANGICSMNSRAPERRVFYIDVGQLPSFKAEAFMSRLQDQFRKKKTFSTKGQAFGPQGPNPVEERWQAPSQDEDFWIPLRPNSNTRVEALPGAQNLGEIDDALYFRNKLFIALNFPKNYMTQEDPSVTKVTLSSIDVKFAKLVERLQRAMASGLTQLAIRHLELRGYPPSLYDDLMIKFTPPSHHREISENEVIEARFNRAAAIKGTMMMSDLDIMTEILKMPLEKAKEIVARSTIQKLQELKLQIMSQNPQLLGIAVPGSEGPEMGTEPGGPPGPELGGQPPPGQQPPQPPQPEGPKGMESGQEASDTYGKPKLPQAEPLPEPTEDDIIKYDLAITDYSQEIDDEEIDPLELDEL